MKQLSTLILVSILLKKAGAFEVDIPYSKS